MALRPCAEPGCPTLGTTTRCATHTRARDRARGTRQSRGYDADHDRMRADYQHRMDEGETFTCWRCDQPIDPTSWDLGHDDTDRTQHRGPECIKCNRSTANRRP